jgi:large subunit ribosomal protein L16
MLEPKKLKFRRVFRGKNYGKGLRGSEISFGEFALQVKARGSISSSQIESARRAIRNYARRGGKLWIRIFPHKPITSKGGEGRMGSGKGPLDHYVAVVKPGQILFELSGLPLKTVFITREE